MQLWLNTVNLSTNGMWVGLKGRMPIILQQIGPALFPENDPLKRNLDIPLSKVRPFAIVEFIGFNAKDPKILNVAESIKPGDALLEWSKMSNYGLTTLEADETFWIYLNEKIAPMSAGEKMAFMNT